MVAGGMATTLALLASSLSFQHKPTDGPFSMDTTTVFKGKSGTNSTAAWPTALLVLTQRIYI